MVIGRAGELERVDALLATARTQASSLVIRGEAGIGKSCLLEEAVARATGFQVLRFTGIQSESTLTFGGLAGLLRPVMGAVDLLAPRHREALAGALALGPPAGDGFLVAMATLELFSILAESRPLLVVVDDLQWVDGGSAQAVIFAARRLVEDPVGTLFAVRDSDGAAALDLPAIDLAGIDTAEAHRLLAERGRDLSISTVDRLVQRTGGNPLALVEIGAALDPLEYAAGPEALKPLAISERVQAALLERAHVLEASEMTALLVAALEPSDDLTLIAAALDSVALSPSALHGAERLRFIDLTPGRLRFRHPLVRLAVQASADAAARRRAHTALATACERSGRAEAAVWHHAAAATGADAALADALDRVGHDAFARGDRSTATRAYSRAAAVTSDAELEAGRLLAAGWAAASFSREAGSFAEAALTRSRRVDLRAQAFMLRVLLFTWNGQIEQAASVATSAVAELEIADPDSAADIAALGLMHAWARGTSDFADRARQNWERSGCRWPTPQGYSLLPAMVHAWATMFVGDPDLDLLVACGQACVDGAPIEIASPVSSMLIAAGQFTMARAVTEQALRRARQSGDLATVAWMQVSHAWLCALTGDLSESLAASVEALDLAKLAGVPWAQSTAAAFIARAEALRGREGPCRTAAAEAAAMNEQHDDLLTRFQLVAAIGLLELGAGRFDAAIEALEPAVRQLRALGLRSLGLISALPDLIEAHAWAHNADRAARLHSELATAVERERSPFALALAARCAAWCAEGADVGEGFERARASFTELGAEFEVARTDIAHGARLRRLGRDEEAVAPLAAAADAFARMGAVGWEARAREELSAAGGRDDARPAVEDERLTPREHQIAGLAATGATTREIAASLFVSPKTVEAHLTRIYRKLDVRSKAQLAHRLHGSVRP